jgi:hypothetical protein
MVMVSRSLIIILTIILSESQAVIRTWSSSSSTDMNLSSNYSGSGSLLTTDTLSFDNTSVINAVSTGNLDVAGVTIASNYTGAWSISGRELICETGNFTDDGITGAHTYGNKITINGASSQIHVGSGVGTINASACTLVVNGTTGAIIDDDKGITIAKLTLGTNAIVTSSGAASTSISNPITGDVFTSGGTLTINAATLVLLTGSGKFVRMLGTTPTINGNNTLVFTLNGSSVSDTIDALTLGGTVAMRVDNGVSGNGGTVVVGGNISTAGAVDIRNLRNSTTFTFTNTSSDLTCGAFNVGASAGTSRTITFNAGTGSYTVSSYGNTLDGSGMAQNINLNSSKWTCSGAWTFGTYHTVSAGTSKVTFSGSGKSAISSVDSTKPFYDVEFKKTSPAVCTLSATTYFKCGELKATSGKVYIPCSLSCVSYINLTTDTLFESKNRYIQTSFYKASTAKSKLISPVITYFTGNVAHDIYTDTSYVLSKFYILAGTANWLTGGKIRYYSIPPGKRSVHLAGSLFALDSAYSIEGTSGNIDTIKSSLAGTKFTLRLPAADTLKYVAFKDCSSSVNIYLDTGGVIIGNTANIFYLRPPVTSGSGGGRRSRWRGWR